MIQVGFLLLFSTEALAHLQGFKACPDMNPIQNFNKTAFLGTWYEIATSGTLSESFVKCISAEYKENSENSMLITLTLINTMTNAPVPFDGKSTLIGDAHAGQFLTEYPDIRRSMVWILDTDYITFAVTLYCLDISANNTLNTIILGRERKLSDEFFEKALTVLDDHNLSRHKLEKTNQENCPHAY